MITLHPSGLDVAGTFVSFRHIDSIEHKDGKVNFTANSSRSSHSAPYTDYVDISGVQLAANAQDTYIRIINNFTT